MTSINLDSTIRYLKKIQDNEKSKEKEFTEKEKETLVKERLENFKNTYSKILDQLDDNTKNKVFNIFEKIEYTMINRENEWYVDIRDILNYSEWTLGTVYDDTIIYPTIWITGIFKINENNKLILQLSLYNNESSDLIKEVNIPIEDILNTDPNKLEDLFNWFYLGATSFWSYYGAVVEFSSTGDLFFVPDIDTQEIKELFDNIKKESIDNPVMFYLPVWVFNRSLNVGTGNLILALNFDGLIEHYRNFFDDNSIVGYIKDTITNDWIISKIIDEDLDYFKHLSTLPFWYQGSPSIYLTTYKDMAKYSKKVLEQFWKS